VHWPAWLGAGAGAVLGAQVAYLGNRRFTFAHEGPHRAAWPRFQVTALLGALLGMGVVAVSVHWGLHYLLGQCLATVLALFFTFLVNRHWTFGSRRVPG